MISRYDARVRVRLAAGALTALVTLGACGTTTEDIKGAAGDVANQAVDNVKDKAGDAAKAVAARALKESYCLRWRALKEGVKLKDNRTVMNAIGDAGGELKGMVPEDQRSQLDTALSAAGQARDTWDKLDPKAKSAIETKFNEASAKIDDYCQGTLGALGDKSTATTAKVAAAS